MTSDKKTMPPIGGFLGREPGCDDETLSPYEEAIYDADGDLIQYPGYEHVSDLKLKHFREVKSR